MEITRRSFGALDGRDVDLFTLDNGRGTTATISTYGGIVTSLCVPDRRGAPVDVVLGFDTLEGYRSARPYFGAIVGRVANRIAAARFALDGVTHRLAANDGANHLHGGKRGWDKVVWRAEPIASAEGPGLQLAYRSLAGEEGYPGTVDVTVSYQLHVRGEFIVEMSATTDAPTPVNVAHHAYWNLGGHGSGSTLDHVLQLHASRYTQVDAALIPTGAIVPVRGTLYDFTQPKTIGAGIAALRDAGGVAQSYDTNYVLDARAAGDAPLIHAAHVVCKTSGITLDLHTTMPGVQLYAGHRLDGIRGKGGAVYGRHAGFCLETQYFPDAINKRDVAGWPDPVLRPGATYRHRMLHRFGLEFP